jgi:glycosyltransferase involved in cell wall biosynthesis
MEPGYEGHSESEVVYLLNPMNPFTWIRACRRLVAHRPDAVAIAWWTVFWAPCFLFVASWLRRKGIKVIFICHNVTEHEPSPWKSMLARMVLSRGSRFVVQSQEEAERLRAVLKEPRLAVHHHPVFEHFPWANGGLQRRASLELLFFGLVRPYKGLDIIIDAMDMMNGEDLFLTVAGEWWVSDGAIRKRAEGMANVEIVDRYIPEPEVGDYFARADAVVLPYRSATGTGVIPLSYRYGKPVIASRLRAFEDVVEDGVSGLFFDPEDPISLARAVRTLLNGPRPADEGIRQLARDMTWEGLASCILGLAGEGQGDG